jgi:hypothetical protein
MSKCVGLAQENGIWLSIIGDSAVVAGERHTNTCAPAEKKSVINRI